MPTLPDDLTYFTVTRTIYSTSSLVADVRFDALVTRDVLPADLDAGTVEILLEPIFGKMVNGVLQAVDAIDGDTGVRLIASTELDVLGGLHYQATFYNASAVLERLVFEALDEDATFNLKDAAVVVRNNAPPTSRGRPGPGFAGLLLIGDGTSIQGLMESDSGPVAAGDPVDLSALKTALVRPIVSFSSPVALTGVTPTDRCYVNRTITQARMRVSSPPAGSALVAKVQSFNGSSWVDVTTLTIADGSVVEVFQNLSYAQVVGNLLRLNVSSVGSTSAATGVVVDVLVS